MWTYVYIYRYICRVAWIDRKTDRYICLSHSGGRNRFKGLYTAFYGVSLRFRVQEVSGCLFHPQRCGAVMGAILH